MMAAEQEELITALKAQCVEISEGRFIDSNLTMFYCPGIVWKLFPELEDKRDSDGLLYLEDLKSKFDIHAPELMSISKAGYFSSYQTPFSFMVHPYLRRGMSRSNNYLPGILQTLFSPRIDWSGSTIRLRIDEDCIMLSKHVRPIAERERWFGKGFSEDISKIATGVTRHSQYFGDVVNVTDYNWEQKKNGIIQLEIEEIHEGEKYRIGEDRFGYKYIHSTYDTNTKHFDHFDGAVRVYSTEQLAERKAITLGCTNTDLPYTKLFRIDGKIPMERWKAMIGMYLIYNKTVAEYFGTEDITRPTHS